MKYIDADKLKAEIDKLYGEYKDKFHQCGDQYHLGLIDGLDMADRVLDTLESEKPMSLDGLEEELDRYLHGEFQQTAGGNFNNYIQVARHFYELGKNSLK